MHFNQSSNKLFLCENFRTNYNVVSYGDQGTDRVKHLAQNHAQQTALSVKDSDHNIRATQHIFQLETW